MNDTLAILPKERFVSGLNLSVVTPDTYFMVQTATSAYRFLALDPAQRIFVGQGGSTTLLDEPRIIVIDGAAVNREKKEAVDFPGCIIAEQRLHLHVLGDRRQALSSGKVLREGICLPSSRPSWADRFESVARLHEAAQALLASSSDYQKLISERAIESLRGKVLDALHVFAIDRRPFVAKLLWSACQNRKLTLVLDALGLQCEQYWRHIPSDRRGRVDSEVSARKWRELCMIAELALPRELTRFRT